MCKPQSERDLEKDIKNEKEYSHMSLKSWHSHF